MNAWEIAAVMIGSALLVALFLAGLLRAAGRASRAEEAEHERTRREWTE